MDKTEEIEDNSLKIDKEDKPSSTNDTALPEDDTAQAEEESLQTLSPEDEIPLLSEEQRIARQHMRRVFLALPVVIIILSMVAYGLYYNKINLARFQKIKYTDLKGVSSKIKYVLRHSTPGALWLFFCLVYVSYNRSSTPAVDPTSGNEHLTQVANKILQNTLEHFVLHMSAQLILVSFITAKQTLNLIPVLNLLFIVGRLLFFFGYPKYRPFGFFLYFLPLMSVMAYIGFRYVRLFL